MASQTTTRTATALLVAVGIFLIAIVLPKVILTGTITTLGTTQALELLLSLLAIATLGGCRFSDYGFRLPHVDQSSGVSKYRWVQIAAFAPLLGIAATVAILALGGNGNPVVKRLSLPQIILFVWVFSSTIEEVFTRGFLQGHLSVLAGRFLRVSFIRVELPVLISALFFACMHLVLLLAGADTITIVVVLLFTFSIGLMAGHLRAQTGSLIPAIVVHVLANVGGVIGGIIYTVISIATGHGVPGM